MSLVHALVAWAPILAVAFAFTVHLLQAMRFESRHTYQGDSRKGPESYTGYLRGSVEHVGWAGGMLTHRYREDTVVEIPIGGTRKGIRRLRRHDIRRNWKRSPTGSQFRYSKPSVRPPSSK